jgi:putative ABC transport system permease protein
MNLVETIEMAAKTLMLNKLRSGLTMLGIIIGNASVIATIGIGEGAQQFVSQQVQQLGSNLLFVEPGSPKARNRPVEIPQTLVLEDAEAIASQVPSVKQVAPQINGSQRVTYRSKNFSARLVGTTPEFITVRNFDIAQGRFFNHLDLQRYQPVAVLGSEAAKILFGQQNTLGKNIRIKNRSFAVIGVMQSKGATFTSNQDETVFLPLTTMAHQISGNSSIYGTKISFISISVQTMEDMKIAQFQIKNLLRLRHKIVDEDDFFVRNQQELESITGAVTGALTMVLGLVASISLLVGGIGIMNIMLVAVRERTQEIGLRKAIGASDKDILLQFTTEAIILSLSGGFIGIAIGVSLILLISLLSPFEAGFSLIAITVSTVISGAIGLFFGIVPAQQAAKLDPIVALRATD